MNAHLLSWTATRTAAFDVRTERDPGVTCRVLGHFAQLGVIPSRVRVRAFADELQVSVAQDGISEHAAEVIAEKLRALVMVRGVRLEHHVGRAPVENGAG